ncbi:MAG: RdgB/HAM1 family non-canonical purine NTP pyrophosphatase [Patescibacteria group bacterium]|nr:RdgB/HAM1 family non-canonical purine NTP pyrophosphatase [Patescibacteria group bacterium]MDE2015314.1 RdgB/HAM1 family non-canonical purine NTP pyrophosphatase [Patescibacteria group bacterium]MDE2227119.1 RdgB/HAM1 family non-canonical purine NTP pyrophosphatase [Patescibacteria group bacterium]
MSRKLLIATGSKGKFPEIVKELGALPVEFLSLADLGYPADYEIEEPAMTFEGNAIIKAMTMGKKSGLLTLADDSGLEVDALGGRPGVFSARYTPGEDADRCVKILQELRNVPDGERGAQFRCLVAIYDPETEKVRTCEGIYRGRIIREEHGTNGFGYDPIFYNDELGKTNAEMSMEKKNSVSHRGAALKKAKEILIKEFLN